MALFGVEFSDGMVAGAGLTAVSLALALIGEVRGDQRWIYVFKPLASLGFLIVGHQAGALASTWGLAIMLGLCLSTVGDVALMWRSAPAFLAGLGAFLLGHLAYAGAFVLRGFDTPAALYALVPLIVVAGGFSAWLLPHVDAKMRAPVVAYVVAITAMVALAVGSHGQSANLWLPVGAVLFFLSDLSVAVDRFVARRAVNRLWGLPCYYAGQLVLAASVAMPVAAG